jgi:hypothetical protein
MTFNSDPSGARGFELPAGTAVRTAGTGSPAGPRNRGAVPCCWDRGAVLDPGDPGSQAPITINSSNGMVFVEATDLR